MSRLFSYEKQIIDLNAKDMFAVESFTRLQKVAEGRIDEKNRIIHDMPLMDMDTISRNRSLYEADGYWAATQSPFIQEKIRRGTLMGELGHPDGNCSRERFLKVELANVAHRNINVKRNGNSVYGDVQYIEPKGGTVWDWITKGINIAISTRVLTPNFEQRNDANGDSYIHKFGAMRLVGWDTVDIPGMERANVVPLNAYDAGSTENWDGIHVSWTKDRKKDEFMNLLKSQESRSILEDIYGFDLSKVQSMSYSQEGIITLNTDNTGEYKRTIKIPTNVYKVNQILCSGR